MKTTDNIFFYIITYPFIWIYEQLEYIFYVYIYPIWSGKPVALGWNPKFVKHELGGVWNPSLPIDIPYHKYQQMSNDHLKEFGIEKTKSGQLCRTVHPQMCYADPEKATMMGELSLRMYYRDLAEKQEAYLKDFILDPINTNIVTYYDKIKWNGNDLLSWNIQMRVKFLWFENIDVIDLFFTTIFFFILFIFYFIFYHLYKMHLRLEQAEVLLNENGLSLYSSAEEITAAEMQDAWREGGKISDTFDLGIEMDYCLYEGSLIGFELFILMFIGYLYKLASFYVYKYIYVFYMVNMEFFTYIFVYLFGILSIYYWFKYKKEKKAAIHRWVELDYYYSHFLNHYYRTLCWLNLLKLADNFPLHAYVIVYTLSMVWIYFGCDSRDYFMGWNQEYRIDVYNKQTNMHFWWPRELMNQRWQHYYSTLIKPLHRRLIYVFLFFFIPILSLYLLIVYYQNKIHVYINNKFFFWNSKRYTIDEIKEQWKTDQKRNIVEEKDRDNRKGRGLIIL